MGGRGGASGITGKAGTLSNGFNGQQYGLRFDYGDGRPYTLYLQEHNGQTYGGYLLDTPNNEYPVSGAKMKANAEAQGAKVKVLSPDDIKAQKAERAKYANVDWELGMGVPWGNASYRKTARMNRINTRASRRRN